MAKNKNIKEKEIIKSATPKDKKEEYYRQVYDIDLKLSKEEKKKLGNDIYNNIKKSKEAMSGYYTKLNKWEKMYEGELDDKNFPWEGCSNTNVPIATSKVDGLVNKFADGLTGVIPYYKVDFAGRDDIQRKKENAIQDWLQKVMDEKIDFKHFIRQISLNTAKQRTGIASVKWKKEIKRRKKIETYTTVDEFKDTYPSAKKAKVDKKEYRRIIKNIKENGSEDIHIEYNDVDEGPKINIVNRENFITCPANIRSLKEKRGCFERTWLTVDDLNRGVKSGLYDKNDVETLKQKMKSAQKKSSPVSSTVHRVEGITPSVYGKKEKHNKEIEAYVGIWRYDINDEGILEPIIVTLAYKEKYILRAKSYPYWNGEDYFIPFRIKSRPNRFDGVSIVERLERIQHEINTMHNQRIDAWTLMLSPTFLKRAGVDMYPDPMETKFFPGLTFEIDDPNIEGAFQQFMKTPRNVPSFMKEEQLLMRYADIVSGLSAMNTGRESPIDPSAPATKTIALLREANVMINEYIENLRVGVKKFAEQILWLYYQYGPKQYEHDGVTFTRDDINPEGFSLTVNAVNEGINQDVVKQKALYFLQTLLSVPMVQQNPIAVRDILSNYVHKWQYSGNIEDVVPSKEKLQQMIQQQQQAQMAQAQQQQGAAAIDQARGLAKEMDEEDVDQVINEITEETGEQGNI